ncbi:MAG: trypsin-like peptidase domain-containing protein [Parcubacteria group bacterium]|nr:trypsin-like peptidase domain-containing protein [Parcubacteria group bacterium]
MKLPSIIKSNKNSIVLLAVVIPGENKQSKISIRGTGFIVSEDGKFITNAHVYNEIPKNELEHLEIKIPTETNDEDLTRYEGYSAELIDMDKENDVALMQIKAEKKVKFEAIDKFADSEQVKEGEKALFIGYPLATELLALGFGITMNSNSCIISAVKRRGADGSLHLFLIDTHTNNGSSGSPVFSEETGEVIGIVGGNISSSIPNTPIKVPANIGICRPIKYVEDIINKNNK